MTERVTCLPSHSTLVCVGAHGLCQHSPHPDPDDDPTKIPRDTTGGTVLRSGQKLGIVTVRVERVRKSTGGD